MLTFSNRNDAFQGILVYYIFENIHKDENIERQSPALKEIYDLMSKDSVIVTNRARLRDVMETKEECLIHADLHASSILIKGDSAKVFIVIKGYINHY